MSLEATLAAAIAQALGEPVRIIARRAIGGGCINHAVRLDTDRGAFFAKWNDAPLPGLFTAEAAGLEAMRSSDTSLRIPAVVVAADAGAGAPGFLVTELLETGSRGRRFDRHLGEGLAELHQRSAAAFGFGTDNYCGSTTQPNRWTSDWLTFYRDQRLGHQIRLATEAGLLDAGDRAACDRLQSRLHELIGEGEAPALIHGDLWSGNLMVCSDGTPALIDPAAYYGHREAELGMMTLFGGFSAAVYEAYEATWPLPAGWRARNPLYQLYHLLNHANLFGGGYTSQAMAIVRRFAGAR